MSNTNHYALWVDHSQAFIYKYTAQGIEEMKIKSSSTEHKDKNAKHQVQEKFYHELTAKLSDAKELMIMGPGIAKDEFKHHLEKHHHKQLASAIVGVETMVSHPTTAMMKKKASEFFKSFHQWTANY